MLQEYYKKNENEFPTLDLVSNSEPETASELDKVKTPKRFNTSSILDNEKSPLKTLNEIKIAKSTTKRSARKGKTPRTQRKGKVMDIDKENLNVAQSVDTNQDIFDSEKPQSQNTPITNASQVATCFSEARKSNQETEQKNETQNTIPNLTVQPLTDLPKPIHFEPSEHTTSILSNMSPPTDSDSSQPITQQISSSEQQQQTDIDNVTSQPHEVQPPIGSQDQPETIPVRPDPTNLDENSLPYRPNPVVGDILPVLGAAEQLVDVNNVNQNVCPPGFILFGQSETELPVILQPLQQIYPTTPLKSDNRMSDSNITKPNAKIEIPNKISDKIEDPTPKTDKIDWIESTNNEITPKISEPNPENISQITSNATAATNAKKKSSILPLLNKLAKKNSSASSIASNPIYSSLSESEVDKKGPSLEKKVLQVSQVSNERKAVQVDERKQKRTQTQQ